MRGTVLRAARGGRRFLLTSVVVACVHAASLPVVLEHDGNVHAIIEGKTVQLTSLGLDSEPVASPDGRMFAFVRRTPGRFIGSGLSRTDRNELWVGELTPGATARKVLTGHAGDVAARKYRVMAGFYDLSFSNDGRSLYFLSTTWATSHALWRVDLDSGKPKLVVAGTIEYAVLREGPHRGMLIANRRTTCRDKRGGTISTCYPYVLVTPDGKEGPRIGVEGSQLSSLLAAYSR